MRTTVVAIVLLAGAFAGCIGGDDEIDGDGPGVGGPNDPPVPIPEGDLPFRMAERTNIEQVFEAIQFVPRGDPDFSRPNMTNRDWLLLSAPLSAEGTVHGFAWQIPEGALIGTDAGVSLVLDAAIALTHMGVPAGLPNDMDWAVAVFHRYADLGSGASGATAGDHLFGVTKDRAVDGNPGQKVPAASDPFSLRVSYEGMGVGDTIWIVLAARGPPSGEFALGLRIMGQQAIDFPMHYTPTTDWDDFHNAVNYRIPYVPERKVETEGLHIAWFHERHIIGESSFQEYSADIDVTELLPTELYPHLTVRDFTLRSDAAGGGWSHARGHYSSGGEVGSYDVSGDLHGVTFAAGEPFMNAQALPDLIAGRDSGVGFAGHGSGSAPASVDWNVQKSGTIRVESLDFVHLRIGVQASELTGLDYLGASGTWGGVF